MACVHWRSDLCRRDPGPPRSQRSSHRSRRRESETTTLQIDPAGLTTSPQLAKNLLPARRPPARRHHLVSPGDIISESVGDFVGICTNLRLYAFSASNQIEFLAETTASRCTPRSPAPYRMRSPTLANPDQGIATSTDFCFRRRRQE